MKSIDFSKVIGLVGRGGYYSPSNDISEKKWNKVFDVLAKVRGFDERPKSIPAEELDVFREVAKECGFQVVTITRGLNR